MVCYVVRLTFTIAEYFGCKETFFVLLLLEVDVVFLAFFAGVTAGEGVAATSDILVQRIRSRLDSSKTHNSELNWI